VGDGAIVDGAVAETAEDVGRADSAPLTRQVDGAPDGKRPGLNPLWAWAIAIVVPVVVFAAEPLIALGRLWFDPERFEELAHGALVPPLCVFFIWLKRKDLVKLASRPTWLGLPVVLAGLSGILLSAATSADIPTLRSNFCLIITIIGLALTLAGWRRFRAMAMPLFFLFFMLPMPPQMRTHLALPMQMFAAKVAELLLEFMGVLVYREGNLIELAGQMLEVGQACSGMSMLMSFLALGYVFAYLSGRRAWFNILLFLSTIPIALLVNIIRVAGTGLICEFMNPDLAQGFLHIFEGYVLFLAGIAFFFGVHRFLIWFAGQLEVETI